MPDISASERGIEQTASALADTTALEFQPIAAHGA